MFSLPMAKWATNSVQLKAISKAEGQNVEAQTQVQGVSWKTDADCLYIDADEINNKLRKGQQPRGSSCKQQLASMTLSGCSLRCPLWGRCYSRTPGAEASTGKNLCLQTSEHDGTLGYLVCLHCRKCTYLDGWLLRWNEAPKFTYFATPQKGHMERLSTFVQPRKTTPLSVWPAARRD